MKVNTLTLTPAKYPRTLRAMPDSPAQLFWAGLSLDQIIAHPRVAIVGSRKATAYGRVITEDLTKKLVRSGVVIVSGLAYGIDSFAHKTALDNGGCTVAVLGTPLQKVSPASNRNLAQQILDSNGALVSEYSLESVVTRENFIARNRIVSALADVLLITEAAKASGTMHTARFALEQGKTVMAVPGNINSPTSEGCNNLIKRGAAPATSVDDVFFALGIEPQKTKAVKIFQGTPPQQLILDLISQGVKEQEELANVSKLSSPEVSSTLTILELQGYIKPLGAGNWTVA